MTDTVENLLLDLEKASFAIAVGVLFALNRVSLPMLGAGFVDLIRCTLRGCLSADASGLPVIDSMEVYP